MATHHSFKFLDNRLNRELARLLKKAGIHHFIDKDGAASYSADDQEFVENDLICSIRDKVFPAWQVLTCPTDWIPSYKSYMNRHEIPFREELSDGERWFLIPRKYRPHLWKLDAPIRKERLVRLPR
jgi:hypothetical protein